MIDACILIGHALSRKFLMLAVLICTLITFLAEQPRAVASGSFDAIKIEVDRQNAFKDGRQKVVVTVTNSADDLFRGKVKVTAVGARDATLDHDTIFLDDGLPGAGSRRFAILWFRKADQIAEIRYEISGEFVSQPIKPPDLQYDELGVHPGINFTEILVYTPIIDRATLQRIVDYYKERYSGLPGFQILFYVDKTISAKIKKRGLKNFLDSDDVLSFKAKYFTVLGKESWEK